MIGILDSVRIGRPRHLDQPEPWVTAFHKAAVSGRVRASSTGLTGDGQADLTVHGGPDKAICVYAGEHYAAWQREIGHEPYGPGWFGENFTLRGLLEPDVAIGDVFRVGSALLQVSQPRSPCSKLARRWNRPDMVKRVVESGRTGWYLRVLEAGDVGAGDEVERIERAYSHLTVTAANRAMYGDASAPDVETLVRELAACPALSAAWRNAFLGLTDTR